MQTFRRVDRGDRLQRKTKETIFGYAFIAPSFLGLVIFLLAPIAVVLWLSLYDWDMISPAVFVGFQNFSAVFADPRFINSLKVTALFVAITLPLQTLLGLFVGNLLNQRLKGTSAFRIILLLPWVSAPLALGIVWKWIFARTDGLVNTLLGTRIEWLGNPDLVLLVICFVAIWSNVGYVALFFSAGLGAIPDDYIDAARLDGASGRQIFWRVKMPLLRPTTFFVLVTGLISSFQVFDMVYSLAPDGGPSRAADVIVGRIYYEAFSSYRYGRAAVMSLVLFAILITFSLLQNWYFRRRTTFEVAS